VEKGLTSAQGADSRPGSVPLRVLIVDDDRDTLVTLMILLREEGYETRTAINSANVWAVMREFDPDVVLLDIGLPDRSGYEVARELRKRFGAQRPTLIAVTAWNKASDRMLAELAGFNHHIGKPYDPQRLLALLKAEAAKTTEE
jgi:two-component system CheB/CheR fusion protein